MINVTLTQLSYAVAVADQGSFQKAAKTCHVTQPTLSMQIQKIEEQLDVLLFDRSKQPVVPTAIGVKVIAQAREVLRAARKMADVVGEEKKSVSGTFRLGVIPTVAPYLVPRFVTHFAKAYPDVHLIIDEMQTEEIMARVKDDQLDGGLLATPLGDKEIFEMPLFYEPFMLYAAKGSPIKPVGGVIVDQDLPSEGLHLLTEGHCLRNQALKLCKLRRSSGSASEIGVQFNSGSLETLMRLIEQGDGYTVLPFLATDQLACRGGAQLFSFAPPAPAREISLVFHRAYLKRQIIEALAAAIKKSLPKGIETSREQVQRLGI